MKKIIIAASLLFGGMFLVGCEEDLTVRQDALNAFAVDINGSWELFSMSRNGEDLSGKLSFTDYSITINEDGTFSLSSSSVPFPTLKTTNNRFSNGTWRFDSDFQPTEIQFLNGSSIVPVKLDQPLFGTNNTNLSIEFSMGCGANTYLYQFKKN